MLNNPAEILFQGSWRTWDKLLMGQKNEGVSKHCLRVLQFSVLSPRFQHQSLPPAIRLQAVVWAKPERVLNRVVRPATVSVL